MKYRKKPVVIDAIKWDGKNVKEVMDFMAWRNVSHDARTGLLIHTLEGNLHANIGDMIIKGVQGEFYACKPDIFAATYEVESSPPLPQQGGEQTAEFDAWMHARLFNDPPLSVTPFDAWNAGRAAISPQGGGATTGVRWDLFPGWLIDHIEGEPLTEEGLQFQLADMIEFHKSNPPVAAPAIGGEAKAVHQRCLKGGTKSWQDVQAEHCPDFINFEYRTLYAAPIAGALPVAAETMPESTREKALNTILWFYRRAKPTYGQLKFADEAIALLQQSPAGGDV